ncbi:MAG: aminotransferase class V-fold PLP-dependent enzyme [Planctomycetes bacterium]|nr:aminotransferase class V-fold PLP-dependent enzyme [Planctomycetota bacterium]
MDKLYLDHAATTPPCPEARAAFDAAANNCFANPGSLHQAGADAARLIESSRRKICKLLGAGNYKLVFTATGTESNHLGIRGFFPGGRAIVGAIEHPSSRAAVDALEVATDIAPVSSDGRIDIEAFKELLNEDVGLISIQWVNNEIGCLQPIHELVQLARQLAPRAHFHIDAIQAAGKFNLHLDQLGADSVAIAAHKFGGIRGCAALLFHNNCKQPTPYFTGGGHEHGLRSGTENTMGIAAMAAALSAKHDKLISAPNYLHDTRQRLITAIENECDIEVIGPADEQFTSGAILTIAIKDMRAEPFLHQLETHDIYIGSGSACNAHGHSESPTLAAVQVKEEMRNSVLRISFSDELSNELALRVATAMALTAAFFKD